MGWWTSHHPGLLLRDRAGQLIIDTQWGEPLLDISTAAHQSELLGVVGPWIDDCATRGYRGVEADNLDSYTRSKGRISAAEALSFAQLLTTRAHADHLAVGQKNVAELSGPAHRAGFDFAIAEECQIYTECDAYSAVYGAHVIEIEYADQPITAFTAACRERGRHLSIVLRDGDVTPPNNTTHVERWCA